MLSPSELLACAHHSVTQHGEDASAIAAMRRDEHLGACDYRGGNHRAIIGRINLLLDPAVGLIPLAQRSKTTGSEFAMLLVAALRALSQSVRLPCRQ
jgi:hypothetical protein